MWSLFVYKYTMIDGMKKNGDFARVYHTGKSKADRNLVVYTAKSAGEHGLFGVSVSKKVGNSVIRHRIKRRLKEIVRLQNDQIPEQKDIVVIARSHAADADYSELEHSFLRLLGGFHD